jgi:hypothetical protein
LRKPKNVLFPSLGTSSLYIQYDFYSQYNFYGQYNFYIQYDFYGLAWIESGGEPDQVADEEDGEDADEVDDATNGADHDRVRAVQGTVFYSPLEMNMAPRGKDPLFTPRDESSPPPQGAQ